MLNIRDNALLYRKWIFLAVSALAYSGILSIIIVFLRIPFISSAIPYAQYIFDNALVIHVNLSILVWMCSVISLLFIVNLQNTNKFLKFLWALSTTSMVLIFTSTFVPSTQIIKSNYIPVLQNVLFLSGLSLFTTTILVNALLTIILLNKRNSYLFLGQIGIVIILISSFLCFILAYKNMPVELYNSDRNLFYEYLFWGMGHLLQFAFAQGMFLVYLIILDTSEAANNKITILPLFINTVSSLGTPFLYFIYPVDSVKLMQFFTWHMRIAGTILTYFLIMLVYGNIKTLLNDKNNYLLHSFALFIYGGVLGILTIEDSVTIPAHYHGSIVGITIAFMNFIYWLLSRLGFEQVKSSIVRLQIYSYSLGHFFHITGLLLLSRYGTFRKVISLPSISSTLARTCFIVGGAVSVIGGMLFIIVVFSHLFKWKSYLKIKRLK